MSQFKENFLSELKQQSPVNSRLVSKLMDMFSLGKEAIYRRLRGEISFTQDETVKIALEFGISLDRLIEESNTGNKSRWAVLDMDKLYPSSDFPGQYGYLLDFWTDVFRNMQDSKKASIRCATNVLPYTLTMTHESLSQFRFYKWAYLTQGVQQDFLFSKIVIPPNISELIRKFTEEYRSVPRMLFILDRNIFSGMVNDILYFFHRNLVTDTECIKLKQELLDLISVLEKLTATGMYDSGMEIIIYLSDITLDTTYIHFEYDRHAGCMNRTFFIETMSFCNSQLCHRQKEWIELLKRYSVLITQSGEAQRFDFFNKQRELVEGML